MLTKKRKNQDFNLGFMEPDNLYGFAPLAAVPLWVWATGALVVGGTGGVYAGNKIGRDKQETEDNTALATATAKISEDTVNLGNNKAAKDTASANPGPNGLVLALNDQIAESKELFDKNMALNTEQKSILDGIGKEAIEDIGKISDPILKRRALMGLALKNANAFSGKLGNLEIPAALEGTKNTAKLKDVPYTVAALKKELSQLVDDSLGTLTDEKIRIKESIGDKNSHLSNNADKDGSLLPAESTAYYIGDVVNYMDSKDQARIKEEIAGVMGALKKAEGNKKLVATDIANQLVATKLNKKPLLDKAKADAFAQKYLETDGDIYRALLEIDPPDVKKAKMALAEKLEDLVPMEVEDAARQEGVQGGIKASKEYLLGKNTEAAIELAKEGVTSQKDVNTFEGIIDEGVKGREKNSPIPVIQKPTIQKVQTTVPNNPPTQPKSKFEAL